MALRLLAAVALTLAFGACASRPAAEPLTFVVVRHAEKASDDPRDPSLTATGQARAQRLAEALRETPLIAAYATAYRRTQQTAHPSAQAHALSVTTYDAKQPAGEFAASLRQRHHAGTVLVVGHSNTVPDIAASLCGCTVEPMPETEYDRLMTIRVDADGHAALEVSRQP